MSNELAALGTVGEFNAHHREAVKSANDAIENALAAGRIALAAKATMPHGEWEAFAERHYDCDIRTTQRYMKSAKGLDALPKTTRMSFLKSVDSMAGLTKILSPPKPAKKADSQADAGNGGGGAPSHPQSPATGTDSTASDGSHDSGTQGGEDSGGGDGTDGAPPAAGKAPTDECPNCRGKNWDEDGDSWACRKCSHPYGEPAEGKEPDKPKAKDSALAKFLEVWSAADALGRIAIEAWWRDYLSDVDAKTVKPRKRGGFTPPTLEDVKEYCASRGKGVNAQQWYDHYTANGWKVGRNSMKDWKAAVRTWEGKTFSQESLAKTKARASRAMEYSE